ncbi:hypothetical protein ACTFIZ_010154 [Dictyostelium cf. discoideum]
MEQIKILINKEIPFYIGISEAIYNVDGDFNTKLWLLNREKGNHHANRMVGNNFLNQFIQEGGALTNELTFLEISKIESDLIEYYKKAPPPSQPWVDYFPGKQPTPPLFLNRNGERHRNTNQNLILYDYKSTKIKNCCYNLCQVQEFEPNI